MNPNLLNKIQAIKTLRDRAATEGEKDAAQNRLTLILAKHKLTEQDIPDQSFSTRGRNTQPRPDPDRGFFDDIPFSQSFEEAIRNFEEAVRAAGFPPPQSQSRPRSTPGDTGWEPSRGRRTRDDMRTSTGKGKKTARERFEKALGKQVSNEAWYTVAKSQKQAKRKYDPDNPAAYARAFYEAAGIVLRHRLSEGGTFTFEGQKLKSSNPAGIAAGLAFGEKISLHWFEQMPF